MKCDDDGSFWKEEEDDDDDDDDDGDDRGERERVFCVCDFSFKEPMSSSLV